MSAGGSSRTASFGRDGNAVAAPERAGARRDDAHAKRGAGPPDRISVGQMLPAADSTSTMPYSAEPAVSGTATTSVSREGFRRVARIRVRFGTKEPIATRIPLMRPRVNA